MSLKKNILNIPGKRLSRKLVVLESDDWGSMRAPTPESLKEMMDKGLEAVGYNTKRYNLYDRLEDNNDLSAIFEVLSSVKDCKGRSAVMTPMYIMANPDFEKIEAGNFEHYFWEPFTTTYQKFEGQKNRTIETLKQGIEAGIFLPQFHGREHLNIATWMHDLKNSDTMAKLAFKHRFWGFRRPDKKVQYQAAFDITSPTEVESHIEIIKDGLEVFRTSMGYPAEYFVPPNAYLSDKLFEPCKRFGIIGLSTANFQLIPLGNGSHKKIARKQGEKNKYGQVFLVRNCLFEPELNDVDWVGKCLKDISLAFRWNKPAVVSNHRTSFMGGIEIKNRDSGLRQLKQLLNSIVRIWPDVEFISSSELIKMYNP